MRTCKIGTRFKEGKLSKERIELLESIGFTWDTFEEEWQQRFQELKKFVEDNGHANPTKSHHSSLANWVSDRRKAFKKDKLSKERIELLESIGFKWRDQ